jgi:parallel beta-helix repeat protein
MKISTLKGVVCLVALFVLCSDKVFGTNVSGPVSGTWTLANSPYYVTGGINVPVNQTLVIQPGVQVIFQGHYKFIVNSGATLQAIGTEQDSILFTATNPTTGWHGIRFMSASNSSELSFCILEYGKALGGIEDPNACGGAIFCNSGSNPTVTNCTIRNNYAWYKGGGICCFSSSPTIENCKIIYNTCGPYGGGIQSDYGSYPTIRNCVISNNYTTGGGGVLWSGSHSGGIIENCLMVNNQSGSSGGAMTLNDCDATISNCTIANNTANYDGGAIHLQNSPQPTITNCIIYGNSAPNGPQIYIYSGSGLSITYSDIQGGWSGTGNINQNPLFVSGPYGSYYLSQFAAGQSQQSPCVDSGNPSSSMITGTTRTDGIQDAGRVDMGYHYAVSSGQVCSTSFNFNEDTYNFGNITGMYEKPVVYLLESGNLPHVLWGVVLTVLGGLTIDGWCYGFATSAVDFFHHPVLIPYGLPYIRLLSQPQAEPIIQLYQTEVQFPTFIMDILSPNPNQGDLYSYIKNKIISNHPVVVGLNHGDTAHAVVAYKIEELYDEAYISIYNPNHPNHNDTIIVNLLPPISFHQYGEYVDFSGFDPTVMLGLPTLLVTLNTYLVDFMAFLTDGDLRLFIAWKDVTFETDTPDDILISDQFGRRVGFWDGFFFNEIPDAEIFDSLNLQCYLPDSLIYTMEYQSNSPGRIYFAGLCPSQLDEEAIYNTAYDSIGVTIGSTASFSFDPTSSGNIEFDYDGDGLIDSLVAPLIDTVMTMVAPQNAPSNFTGQVLSQRKIDFNWQSTNTTALGSIVYKQIPPDTSWTAIYFGSSHSFIDTMLAANTQHLFRVCDYNAGGNSPYSDTLNLTTPPMPVPSLLTPADSTVFMNEDVTLSWTPVDDAVHYHIQVASDTAFTELIMNDMTVTGTEYSLPDTCWGWMQWRVRAADCVPNWSDWSEPRSFFRSAPIPQGIQDLIIERSGNNIVLSWSPVVSDTSGIPVAISYYVIYASSSVPFFEPTSSDSIGFVTRPDSTYIDLNALTLPKRFYSVKAVIQ